MDERWMRRAIEISRGGYPAPNPHVGCVIVQDGELVSEGFHHFAGGPHAEIEALEEAGSQARGADVYVSLEPCNHHGRTPPCARALIEAGVRRVFVACPDPNPVASHGADTLRKAGIEVRVGVLQDLAKSVNFQFFRSLELGRPVITLKLAMGVDGRIALPNGQSKWITGPEAREESHRMRVEAGSVLVGYRTVLADDPELTARIEGVVNQPLRIVLDPGSKLSGREKVFNDAAETLHITQRFSRLEDLIRELGSRKVRGVLVEGGAGVISAFVSENLFDRVEIFVAPKYLGSGLSWLNLKEQTTVPASQLRFDKATLLGEDLLISARPIPLS